MKLWSRFVLGSLVLALALSLAASPAAAASKKKKKEEKHETRHETSSYEAPSKHYLSGANLQGRSGLFFGDTSEVAAKNAWEGSLHATWASPTSYSNFVSFPIGGHLGLGEDFELSAGVQPMINFYNFPAQTYGPVTVPAQSGSSSAFLINAGGKYRIPGENRNTPDFSVGGNIYVPTYTGGQVVVMPEGTCTYVIARNGLLLNGDFGIGISSTTYVKFDAGVGYPVSPKVTLIGEIGANQTPYNGSMLGGSMFGAGARFDLGNKTKAQALLGVPLNGGGVLLGAGIILASE